MPEASEGQAAGQAAQKDQRKSFRETPPAAEARLSWSGEGGPIEYTARAGHILVREDDGSPVASMFAVSYCASAPSRPRPVTFCFNGGPGSSSVWLNVGGIGPRRVAPDGDRRIGPAPYRVEDNPDTMLRATDLVFIDAPGTGWSLLAEGVEGKRAWGVDADADCFARCIEAWLEETGRWNDPLYLYGESYGTTRCAVLAGALEARGIALSGIVMLSAIFDWAPTLPGSDACYTQMFPTFAAIASYHGRSERGADEGDEALFDAACEFAESRLAPALLLGDRLGSAEEDELAGEMSSFIGLPRAYILRKHLRVELTDFRQELLRDERRVCGRLDGRFAYEAGNFLQGSSEGAPEDDPTDAATTAAWSAGFRHVLATEVGYRNPAPYVYSAWETVGLGWDFSHKAAQVANKAGTPNVAYDLAQAMRRNPAMRVLVAGGRYDLACPFLGPVEDMSRMYLGPQVKANLFFRLYASGHMVYVNPRAASQLAADAVSLLYEGR